MKFETKIVPNVLLEVKVMAADQVQVCDTGFENISFIH